LAHLRRSIRETRAAALTCSGRWYVAPFRVSRTPISYNSGLAQRGLIHDGGQGFIPLSQPQQRCRFKFGHGLGFDPDLGSLCAKFGGGALSEGRAALQHRVRSIARKLKFQRLGESLKPLRQAV
jgi:hypothetical protein